jgi:C4-dicarboxylate-specific signal transduction histidine kinase
MSELEVAQERLAKEEKLSAIGRLASGIAHEIRNPVAIIADAMRNLQHSEAQLEIGLAIGHVEEKGFSSASAQRVNPKIQ